MLKRDARKLFKEKRRELTSSDQMKLDDLLLIQFQKLQFPFLSYALSFFPIEENHEVNTFIFTAYLQFKNPGMHVTYPKTNFSNEQMQAILDKSENFVRNAYNIYEPVSGEEIEPQLLDLVFVPLLVCDKNGNRVGYGKGFYDRFLKLCRPDCLKVGLSYFEPIEVITDTNEFDVPLDFCITPQKAYVF
jgi:5-formyltetrahydrofolate cyclo-ligase